MQALRTLHYSHDRVDYIPFIPLAETLCACHSVSPHLYFPPFKAAFDHSQVWATPLLLISVWLFLCAELTGFMDGIKPSPESIIAGSP
jgi:hypothetical protein